MADLEVTLGGVVFPHLVFHLVFVYSNVEAVRICFSEMFEALAEGFESCPRQPGGYARLRGAVEAALQLGCTDAAAVCHLMAADGLAHQRPVRLMEIGRALTPYERPLPHVNAYDELLVRAVR